jgi:hypothetical protein
VFVALLHVLFSRSEMYLQRDQPGAAMYKHAMLATASIMQLKIDSPNMSK